MRDTPFVHLPTVRAAWLDEAARNFPMGDPLPADLPDWGFKLRRILALGPLGENAVLPTRGEVNAPATGSQIAVAALLYNVPLTTLRAMLFGIEAPTLNQVEEAAIALREAGIAAVLVEDL